MHEEELDFTMGLDKGTSTANMTDGEKWDLLRANRQEWCRRCGEIRPHSIHQVLRNPLAGQELSGAVLA